MGSEKVCDTASSQGSLLANPLYHRLSSPIWLQVAYVYEQNHAKPLKVGLQRNTSVILQPPMNLANVSGSSRQLSRNNTAGTQFQIASPWPCMKWFLFKLDQI